MTALPDTVLYTAGFIGTGVALFAAWELRRSQHELRNVWNKRQQTMQSEIGKLRGLVQELKSKVDETERRSETQVAPAEPIAGLNMNRRTQAMRLIRRGEKPEQVATALSVPKREVELLLKVHRIITSLPTTPPERNRMAQEDCTRQDLI